MTFSRKELALIAVANDFPSVCKGVYMNKDFLMMELFICVYTALVMTITLEVHGHECLNLFTVLSTSLFQMIWMTVPCTIELYHLFFWTMFWTI